MHHPESPAASFECGLESVPLPALLVADTGAIVDLNAAAVRALTRDGDGGRGPAARSESDMPASRNRLLGSRVPGLDPAEFARVTAASRLDLGDESDRRTAAAAASETITLEGGTGEERRLLVGGRLGSASRRPHRDAQDDGGAPRRPAGDRSHAGSFYLCLILVDAERDALRNELARLTEQLRRLEREAERRRAAEEERSGEARREPEIVGRSDALLRALDAADRVAPTDGAVLVLGETGAGKELIARRVHARSARRDRAFVEVNCAALPETLLESELFGHERGAFTGADRRRIGRFELADGGTLFLDEIGELSPAAQARLLRVLQDGSFQRVGGAETLVTDVRLVAATHRNLASLVKRGRFREDLFYRLNVFAIELAPLRERREDVRPLAEHLHRKHARRMGRTPLPLSDRAIRKLMAYRWPGNVRELENVVERATILLRDEHRELDVNLPGADSPGAGEASGGVAPRADAARSGAGAPSGTGAARDVLLDLTADQLQRLHIMHALETSRWTVFGDGGAARKLGVNPQTLLSRMDKLGIPRPRKMRSKLG